MKWQDFGRSANVEDRRGGGGMVGKGGLGVGTVVVLGLLGWAFGIDPRLLIGGAEMLNSMRQGGQTNTMQPGQTALARIPARPKSTAIERVSASMPAFEVA